jgi:hypothetical protein
MVIIIFLSGLFAPKGWNWALVMLFMIVFIALIGKMITNRYSGIFIDERYMMSLSRFQLVIWTLIVLSAFLTIALERVYAGVPNPLAIALPTQLWELLGISTTSLVGSPLIQSVKVQKKPNDAAVEKAVPLFVSAGKANATKDYISKNVEAFGISAFNEKPADANFSNLFTGDEIGNIGQIDMGKVQMFFFTLVIAFSYMVLLVNLIMTAQPAALNSFPQLDNSVVALLGISAAGFLTNKAVDHTKTQ